jgi:uncharacterized protein YraI
MKMYRILFTCMVLLLTLNMTPHPAVMQPATPTPTPNASVVLMDSNLRVRDQPGVNGAILASIPSGTPLLLLGKTPGEGWLQIQTADGIIGWVAADYVSTTTDFEALPVTGRQTGISNPITLSPRVSANIQQIYTEGQAMGSRAGVFSKVGDSITAAPHMFLPIGSGNYTLGEHEYLKDIIDYFSQIEARPGYGNSFLNPSLAAAVGWTTSVMYDTDFADPDVCLPDETPLHCEYRVVKPSVALIMLGTNDLSRQPPEVFRGNISGIVEYTVDQGIIPILSMIPNREGYEETVIEFNAIIAEVADDFAIPLWDYYTVMQTLPDGGLAEDGVHPTIPPKGEQGSADFRAGNLYYGYVVRNLTALQMLDAVWQACQTLKRPAQKRSSL